MVIFRKYITATVAATYIRIPMVKRGLEDFANGADWTPAAGDVTVSKEGCSWSRMGVPDELSILRCIDRLRV